MTDTTVVNEMMMIDDLLVVITTKTIPMTNPLSTANLPEEKKILPVTPAPVTVVHQVSPPHHLVHRRPVVADLPRLHHRRVTPAAHDRHPTPDPHHLPGRRKLTVIYLPIGRLKRLLLGRSLLRR